MPNALQRNTWESGRGVALSEKYSPSIGGNNGQALGGGCPTDIVMMCPLVSKVEDSLEMPVGGGRIGWRWAWDQQFNLLDGGAEVDSSFLNNQDLLIHITDNMGYPFDMVQETGAATPLPSTLVTTFIQWTFKFSIVYESQEPD